MKLSIVIVSWNTRDLLIQCLQSVQENIEAFEPRAVETIVVDNASTDGTVQAIREQFPWVQIIDNGVNVGFAQANNQAIRASTGEYVLLLNPDTLLLDNALITLVDWMDKHPQLGAAGAQLLNADGSLQTSCYRLPTLGRELWHLLELDTLYPLAFYEMRKWPIDRTQRVDVVQGACLLVRRRTLDQVGLLAEEYFMYSEEVDLCHRILKAGWAIEWVPQAQVIHFGGKSTEQIPDKMFLHLYQSKLLYFEKNHGWLAKQTYKAILLLAALLRLLYVPIVCFEPPNTRRRHLNIAGRYSRLILNLHRM
jgi:hypothetical protein